MYLNSHITKTHLKCLKKDDLKYETPSKIDPIQGHHEENELMQKSKVFKCNFLHCNKVYSTQSSLQRHRQTSHKASSLKCNFGDCNSEFLRSDHLKAHISNHLKPITILKQNLKSRNQNESEISSSTGEQTSLSSSSGSQSEFYSNIKQTLSLNCKYCLVKFENEQDLNNHLKSHEENNFESEKVNEYLKQITSEVRDARSMINVMPEEKDCSSNGEVDNEMETFVEDKENNDFIYIYNMSNESQCWSAPSQEMSIPKVEDIQDKDNEDTLKSIGAQETAIVGDDTKCQHVINMNSGKVKIIVF